MYLADLSTKALEDFRRVVAGTYVLLHDEKRHTTKVEARRADGSATSYVATDAVQFCLLGGINHVRSKQKVSFSYLNDPTSILDACAVELKLASKRSTSVLRPSARANDRKGHEAALKILRCSMQKVRAELKRRAA
jgi:hypothetical protein